MNKPIGKYLIKRRREAGLSQERLAWILAVSVSTVSRWERDKSRPKPGKLLEISRACGLSKFLAEEDK